MSYISVDDRSNEQFMELFKQTAEIKTQLSVNKGALRHVCPDVMMGMMFYEPSTRTSGSFNKAITFLGGMPAPFDISTSSIAKGETLEDTARMIAMACDILVVRHSGEGTCRTLETILRQSNPNISIINAGEGKGEHPTQALLDMYTIWENFGRTDVTIGLYGDLAHGRTAHSLIKLASRMGATIVCAAPRAELEMPQEYIRYARDKGAKVIVTDNIESVAGDLDVIYTTRLQRERGASQDKIEAFEAGSGYGVTPALMKLFNPKGIVMHPLPRVDELSVEVDADPRAKYFQQAENGIYTRMALIVSEMNRPIFAKA